MPYSKTTDISQLIDLNSEDTIDQKELNERETIMKSAGNKVRTGGIRETYMFNMDNRNNSDFTFEKYEPKKQEPKPQFIQPPSKPSYSSHSYPSSYSPDKIIEHPSPKYEGYQGYNGYQGQKFLSCIDVCNHVNSCPVCSRFYNNDKTVYIIIIVLLSIITVICFKKILNI